MDITCLLSAVLFFAGNLLIIIFYAKESRRSHFDYDTYLTLDPDYIKQEWEFRTEQRPLFLAASIVNSLAWFTFCIPMIQLAWVLSHRGTKSIWLHTSIAILALGGSFTEWIARFLYIGSSMSTELIYNEFNLNNWISSNSADGIGLRTLEVTHIVTSGLIWFVDAFEWITLALLMILVHVSVRRWRTVETSTFGGCWNNISLFIALLSVLDFVAEILRLDGFRTFNQIAFWYAAVNRLILFPVWLILLGLRLPYASLKLSQQTHAMGAGGTTDPAIQEQSAGNDAAADGGTSAANPFENSMS